MKLILFVLGVSGLALVALSCGGGDAPQALTEADYSRQGNSICDQMNAELDGLSIRASSGVSPEDERDLFVQASEVSRQAIDALFDLAPPPSLVEDRQSLLDLAEERRRLIDRLNNGEDLFDQLTAVNEQFEIEAQAIWPNCTT